MIVIAATVFLPWQTTATESGTESVQGVATGEGPIVLAVSLITAGLIQMGWRPAWIGAGFVGASTIRRILDSEVDPAFGLWIAAAASIVAVVLLVWEMFATVSASGGEDKPPRHGLSGPLGRRRR